MKGKGKSTDAPKGGRTTKRAKAEKHNETAKGKAQGNKKRKQGKSRNGKEPSSDKSDKSDKSDESDVYFYNDLQRWKNNVKVPIWLKKPKDKESINEFYKNVIKKLLRVKNKIRAYQIEEAYLIDCLRKCLMDLNLNSISSLDYVNYEMVRRLSAGDCSAFFKNDEKDQQKGKCFKPTKEQGDQRDNQKDIVHEPILKDDKHADQTTHIRVDCATDKVSPLPAEHINCLIESLKNVLSVEQKEKKKDLMRHVFNKVIIPGSFFENNNFCPIFMNLLKLDIYNACCLSGKEIGPKLMSLIQLLNNFDEGGAKQEGVPSAGAKQEGVPSAGEKQKGVPSASSAGIQKGDSQQGDAQQGGAQQGDDPQRVGNHHNEPEDNSYREDRLFFQSQTSLFKLSQYCIEKGVVENHQVASFDTIYIYSGKEPQSGPKQSLSGSNQSLSGPNQSHSCSNQSHSSSNQSLSGSNKSQCDSHKYKHKKKKLLPHGNLKYSLDITKKENESLHFINEKRAILENDSTRRSMTHRGDSYEEELKHTHVERQYAKDGAPVKEGNEDEAVLSNDSVTSVKAKESPCGREVLEILSHSDEKEELQDGEIAPVEKEAISVEGSINETEQSFESAVSSVKGTSKFDYGGSHPKCYIAEEGSKEDPLDYLQNDWFEFDEGGNVAGRGELDEEFLHGGDTNGCEAPRRAAPHKEAPRKEAPHKAAPHKEAPHKAAPPTGTERCRLYKENEPKGDDQIDELPLQVAQSGSHNTERNTKLRKRKQSQSDHSSLDETQSVQFDTFELFMDNGKIKKKKKMDNINEFEDVPIEVRNSSGKWHDSRCSDFTGAHVRVQLEGSEMGCGRDIDGERFANRESSPLDGDGPLNRNDHVTSSIEKNPSSARPSSGHSQVCQGSDTSVIVEMIHYDRKKDSDSGGRGVNPKEKFFPPSTTRPKCSAAVLSDECSAAVLSDESSAAILSDKPSAAVLSDFSGEKEGHPDEEEKEKNLRSVIDRFCDDANVSCVIDMHDFLKGDDVECLPPKVTSHSEVIVLEDDGEEGNEDNGGGRSARGSHDRGIHDRGSHNRGIHDRGSHNRGIHNRDSHNRDSHNSAGNCEGTPQTEKCTPWGNPPRRDESDASISEEPSKTRETRSRNEISILNVDINKMNNVVLEGLMEFFGLKSKRLSRKIQITELTKIQSYLNEQYEEMAREYHPPIVMQKDHPKLRKGKAIERDYQTESDTYHDKGEGEKGRMWTNGCSAGNSTQKNSHQGSPAPLNDEQAKSQEDYLNRMKKKIKQMELKSLFERIDEAIGVNEVLHDHIKRDKQIEYSLLKRYLVDCKLSVNREIVMSYCKDKGIQVVLKKKAKV
ncbi:hypothetical protein PCYB_145040 [Plasmodium cynomolgi strain B]|uniref:Uncharacterized protein n=1 Tax=Plasmodium cynomolgi (strain B) TaxID=1120755 RepID=K6UEW8_PLACD|nr:hypothetical protein PCYB_145040 [Plasmodium cynomolgi strain B]GAB69076.1 hypothetical protein PCYB_145040 [Plasmodium cynomolgi strain B]